MLALGQSLLLLLSLAVTPGAPRRADGAVVQVTAARAYLDAGSDEGLAAGGEIVLRRGHVEVARCRIEPLAARSAACVVAGARVGDLFALPAPSAREEPKLLAPPPTPEALAAQGKG